MNSSADSTVATIAAYEEVANAYSQHSLDRSGLAHLHARFVELLRHGARVLDLGGGPGHDAAELGRRGLAVVNCDPAAGLLAEAKGHPEIEGRLVQAGGRWLPFGLESFDGIWACASLLHIAKSEVLLALLETHRVIRHGGVLFTSMQQGAIEGIVTGDDSDPVPSRYYAYYTADEWLSLVNAAGFVLLEQRVANISEGLNLGATGWIETFARKS